MVKKLEVFISYAHEDELLWKELEKHLALLKRQGFISTWHDRNISAGTEWAREIDTHLKTADIILLLVSPDFLASNYCYSVEMMQAMRRHGIGEARVIPILLRPTLWKGAPFGRLQALPTNAEPVTSKGWHTHDEAFLDVARGIQIAVEELAKRPPIVATSPQSATLPVAQPIQPLFPQGSGGSPSL